MMYQDLVLKGRIPNVFLVALIKFLPKKDIERIVEKITFKKGIKYNFVVTSEPIYFANTFCKMQIIHSVNDEYMLVKTFPGVLYGNVLIGKEYDKNFPNQKPKFNVKEIQVVSLIALDDENEIESESYCIYVPSKPQDTISRIIETSSLI